MNNESEYEALLSRMCIVQQLGIKCLDAYVDSQLMANQVPRGQNKKAYALSKLVALAFDNLHKNVWVEELTQKSIDEKSTVAPIEEESLNRMTPILKFLIEGMLPTDEKEERKVHMKAPIEIHEGYCALHSDYRTIAAKVMRIWYYWPTIHKDSAEVVRTCQSCQQHAPISRSPRHPMIPITVAWPFCKWSIDIVGPITECSGGIKFLVVAIDYFTKWVESKALVTITTRRIRNFFWEDIVCSLVYGTEAIIPAEILVPTKRVQSFDESSNGEGLRANLDMLEEHREIAAIQEAMNKHKISKYYDMRVKPLSFKVGEYVWRNNEASRAEDTGKFGPNWECP
ncbi:uncharacterized protein [Rutidosis leptorrhynchoides]|uniref:uncharacterized protein n=1 Tax=Rutidosis leptorrhynchoides TaxID=125765 RepID=UPI003A9A41E0